MSSLLADLADLFLPADCAVCAAPGRRLCPDCGAVLQRALSRPLRVEQGAAALPLTPTGSPLPTLVAGGYTGPVSSAVLAFKDHDALHLRTILAPALLRAVRAALADPDVRALWAAERLAGGLLHASVPAPVLVPVPGSLRGHLRRGCDPLAELLAAPLPWPAPVRRDLVRPGRPTPGELLRPAAASHAGTSSAARRRRRRGWRVGRAPVPGIPVVLVDDVVTTGATLTALARAVRRAGGVPVAAAAVAGVAPPDSPTGERGAAADTVAPVT
ncbi:ComF family protein [Micrococcus luteus]